MVNDLFSMRFSVRVGYLNIEFFIQESPLAHVSTRPFPHNHHNCELRYVECGECSQVFEDTVITAGEGDVVLIPPMYYHYRHTENGSSELKQYGIRFFVKPPSQKKKQEQLAYKKAVRLLSSPRKLHDDSGRILSYLKQINCEIANKETGYVSATQCYAALIFTELFRLFDDDTGALFCADESEFHGRDYMKIDGFFEKNFCRPEARIEDCAALMHLSPRQIDRVLYKMYGMTFSQKLKEMRLKRAAYLLKNTDETMVAVSIQCGFNSYSAFHACFKKEYGMSPTEYRRS